MHPLVILALIVIIAMIIPNVIGFILTLLFSPLSLVIVGYFITRWYLKKRNLDKK